jgi:hypothetical protein
MKDAWGEPLVSALLEQLPPMASTDIATKQDVDNLAIQLRGDLAELRGESCEVRWWSCEVNCAARWQPFAASSWASSGRRPVPHQEHGPTARMPIELATRPTERDDRMVDRRIGSRGEVGGEQFGRDLGGADRRACRWCAPTDDRIGRRRGS